MLAPLQFPFSPSSATPSPNSHQHPTSTAVDGYNPVIKQSSTRSLYSTMMAHASGNYNCGNFYIINAFIVNVIYIYMHAKWRLWYHPSTYALYSKWIRHIHKWRLFIVYMPHKQKVRPTLNSRPNLPWFRSLKLDHLFSNCVVWRLTVYCVGSNHRALCTMIWVWFQRSNEFAQFVRR